MTANGMSPSGKAPVSGTGIRGFESLHPSQNKTSPFGLVLFWLYSAHAITSVGGFLIYGVNFYFCYALLKSRMYF